MEELRNGKGWMRRSTQLHRALRDKGKWRGRSKGTDGNGEGERFLYKSENLYFVINRGGGDGGIFGKWISVAVPCLD